MATGGNGRPGGGAVEPLLTTPCPQPVCLPYSCRLKLQVLQQYGGTHLDEAASSACRCRGFIMSLRERLVLQKTWASAVERIPPC
jgi:hypothetical protein